MQTDCGGMWQVMFIAFDRLWSCTYYTPTESEDNFFSNKELPEQEQENDIYKNEIFVKGIDGFYSIVV